MSQVVLEPRPEGAHLRVHVKPRASKSRVIGIRGDALDVAVAAPPVDGEANAELVRLLARHFGVAQGRVTVVSGASGRTKVVRLGGLGVEEARTLLPGAAD